MGLTWGETKALCALFVTVFAAVLMWLNTFVLGVDDPFSNFIGNTVDTVGAVATENPLTVITDDARELREQIDARNAALYEASLDMDGFQAGN